jgi:predicted dehydrogenase
MKALFIGLGSIGMRHLKNLYSLGVKDFSAYRYRMNTPPEELPNGVNLNEFSSYEDALGTMPDIVVISNPSAYHIDYAMKAMEKGCHVYLEKPISHNISNIDQMLKLCNKKQVNVQVGCQLRVHPHLIKIKNWLNSGELGEIYSVSADVGEYLPGWHPWEDYRDSYASKKNQGGGVVLTLIHEIDYLYWLFEEIDVIAATGGNLTDLEMDVEDTALMLMRSKNNVPIQLRMDYWRSPPVRTLNIVGKNGEINWDYHKMSLDLHKRNEDSVTFKLDQNWDRNNLFIDLMDDFIMSIKNRTTTLSPLKDGVAVLKIADEVKNMISNQS